MSSIDDLLADDDIRYTPVAVAKLQRVPQSLRDEHAELDALLPTLVSDTIDHHPDREATARRLAELEAEMEASTVEIKLRGIGHRAWADLLKAAPPRPEHRKASPGIDHNPEVFPICAIAASSFEPKMTEEQVMQLVAKPWFNEKCWSDLWGACLRANVVDEVPKSLAAGAILRLSGASGTTAVNEASPAPSSSVAL